MRAVALHALLAVAGLGWAYQTWTREPEQEPSAGEVVVVDCKPGQFESVTLEDTTKFVTVTPDEDQGEDKRFWISTRRKIVEPAPEDEPGDGGVSSERGDGGVARAEPDGGRPDEMTAPRKSPRKTPAFLGNERLADQIQKLTPLRAVRTVGKIPEEREGNFGFDQVSRKLQLTCGGKTHTIEVGDTTYGGVSMYARLADTREVFMIAGSAVRDLQNSRIRFMQKDLIDVDMTEIDAALVRVSDTEKEFLQRNPKDRAQAMWVAKEEPNRRHQLFQNWLRLVRGLTARDYLERDVGPGADLEGIVHSTDTVATLTLSSEGQRQERLEVVKVEGASAPGNPQSDTHYYAKSDTSEVWVTVAPQVAEQIERDAPMVVGLEPPPQKPKQAERAPEQATPQSPGGQRPGSRPGLPPGHP